ncbi:MAG TPA: ferritin family protein [Methanoregulaceae archaeon]|nr:ferritin family protein [Methanoregulaceae archaeon]
MNPEEYRRIISMAIDREVEAYSFYNSVAEKVRDENLKSLFRELAGEETSHREFLQKLLSKDVASLGFSTTKDYKVGDSIPTPPLTPDMKPVDGLVVAIKKELEAMQMYTALANVSEGAEQKKLFTELATMERGHKARLEDIYVNTAYAEVW